MDTSRPGPFGSLLALLGSVGGHLELLAALLAQESREAGGRVLRALILLAVGLLFAGLGYIFLILGLAFVLNALVGWPWWAITIGLALVHLGGAAFLIYRMIEYFKTPAYPSLRAELQKDLRLLGKNLSTHGQTPTP